MHKNKDTYYSYIQLVINILTKIKPIILLQKFFTKIANAKQKIFGTSYYLVQLEQQ